jgi:thiol-disulfide isomerase/thioredoxin
MVKYFFVIAVSLTTFCCSSRKEEKPAVTETAANEYPDLTLTFATGQKLLTKQLQGRNVFILFQPECDHCQQEAVEIERHLDQFKDYTLYFISSSPIPEVSKFAENYKLNNRNNVKFAVTPGEGVLNFYGPIPTPSVYIYSNGKLINYFNGQTTIENILASL